MNTNRIYGHQELALLYFPNVLPSSASTQLTRFIRRDPELLSALEAIGYRKGIRLTRPCKCGPSSIIWATPRIGIFNFQASIINFPLLTA